MSGILDLLTCALKLGVHFMKKYLLVILVTALFPCVLFAQEEVDDSGFFSPEFNWHIGIPPGFTKVDPESWDLQKGIQDSLQVDSLVLANAPKTILAFKSNDYNYFESNWQPYNTKVRGDYNDHCQAVSKQLYRTFAEQIPDAQIDTASSVQIIGTLEFKKFVLKMTLPNGVTLSSHMYSRLFDDKEFSANLFYTNDDQGTLLMEAWLYSRFE